MWQQYVEGRGHKVEQGVRTRILAAKGGKQKETQGRFSSAGVLKLGSHQDHLEGARKF